MKIEIAPSILSADFARLGEELAVIEDAGADIVHLDVMDGHFVPNLTIGPPVVKALRSKTQLPFDCHLMITDPQKYIGAFADAGANMISVHIEADPHLHRTLTSIRERGVKAGIAVNPATPAEIVYESLQYCDYVLVMSVNPGFGGQKFIRGVVPKIRRIRDRVDAEGLNVRIEVDGGVDSSTAGMVAEAGATMLVAGSAVFGDRDRRAAIAGIRRAAEAVVREA